MNIGSSDAVEGNFPRLTAAAFTEGIPPGVSHVFYTLALAAFAKYLMASSPTAPTWQWIRSTL